MKRLMPCMRWFPGTANSRPCAMTQFFLALMRITVLSISFLLSTLTAALFITFVLFLGSDVSWLRDDASVIVGSIGFATGAWFTIAQLVFAPFVLLILVFELSKKTSLLLNLLAGGACAVVALLFYPDFQLVNQLPYANQEIWLASISSGFVGGFSHWLFAGHRAGRWLMRKHES